MLKNQKIVRINVFQKLRERVHKKLHRYALKRIIQFSSGQIDGKMTLITQNVFFEFVVIIIDLCAKTKPGNETK